MKKLKLWEIVRVWEEVRVSPFVPYLGFKPATAPLLCCLLPLMFACLVISATWSGHVMLCRAILSRFV